MFNDVHISFGAKFKLYARSKYDTPDKVEPVIIGGIEPYSPHNRFQLMGPVLDEYEMAEDATVADQLIISNIGNVPKLQRERDSRRPKARNLPRKTAALSSESNFLPRVEMVTQVIDPDGQPEDRKNAMRAILTGMPFQIAPLATEYPGLKEYEILTGPDVRENLPLRSWKKP